MLKKTVPQATIFTPYAYAVAVQGRSVYRVSRILSGAYRILLAKGFLNLEGSTLQTECCITRTSIYRYFNSTEHVIHAVICCLRNSGKVLSPKEDLLIEYYNTFHDTEENKDCINQVEADYKQGKRLVQRAIEGGLLQP